MKSFTTTRRHALATMAGMPLVLAGCAAPANQIAAPAGFIAAPAIRSGQRWRYQRINRFNDEPVGELLAEVVQVSPQLVVRLSDAQNKVWGEEIYTEPWRILQEPFYNEQLRFDAPVPLLPEQLAVGATAAASAQYRTPGGGTQGRPWRSTLKAIGWERITVPAGQFDCLRIERKSRFEPHQMGRFRAYRDEILWYAPAVNRWVQRQWAGFYLDETTLPDPGSGFSTEEREDTVRWVLVDYQSAPVAG